MADTGAKPGAPPSRRGRRLGLWIGGGALAVLVALVGGAVLFAGPLLRPIVEAQASAALGRPVSIGKLHIAWGRRTTITAYDVVVGNPEGFPAEAAPWLARVPRLTAQVEPLTYLRERVVVVPRIELERPQVEARALEDGRANYLFETGAAPAGEAAPADAPDNPRIGAVVVRDGTAHVAIARLAADFQVAVRTEEAQGEEPRLLADARGTYAGQPITAQAAGGAILNLRDAERPWPLRLDLANGPVTARLEGTVRDPLGLRGADMRLTFAGPDMARLQPLTGVPFPATPPFRITGRLDYAAGRVRFMQAEGTLGRSDISGGVIVTTDREKPLVAAELRSRRVDLADIGGFIGAEPGRRSTPGQTGEQRARVARAETRSRLLPDAPLDLPKLDAADVSLDYSAERIEGRGIPFDGMATQFDIRDGAVDVKRIVFPIGRGQLAGRFTLTPQEGGALRMRGDIELQRVDFSRLVGAAGGVGSGTIGGVGRIEGTGRSLSEMLARGEGGLTFVMVGGTLSALLVDLAGLQFGRAVLSALGVPDRERVECLVGDFALGRGALTARTLVMETDSAVITGGGSIGLPSERLNLRIRSESKSLSVGALPAPILISGTLKDPGVGVEAGELAVRGGAAVGLGLLAPPLALLPTIQLGTADDAQCERMRTRARRAPAAGAR